MNILVCVSRVPDTAVRVKIGSDGKTIDGQGVKFVVNPYDEFALEEALRLRTANGGEVTAVTVGSAQSTDILRTALAMGVDKVTLIKGRDDADSYYVAKNLADYAIEINAELILIGKQSVDYDSMQMASMLGELAGMPSVSVVTKLEINGGAVKAERDIEGGKEIVETSLPCVISCQKGLNDPRYPKLPDIMKAKKKPIEERDAVDVANRVSVLSMELPTKQRVGKIVGAETADIDEVVRALHEDAKVI